MGFIITATISRGPHLCLPMSPCLATASVKTSGLAVPSLPLGAVLPMAFASEGHHSLNHACAETDPVGSQAMVCGEIFGYSMVGTKTK